MIKRQRALFLSQVVLLSTIVLGVASSTVLAQSQSFPSDAVEKGTNVSILGVVVLSLIQLLNGFVKDKRQQKLTCPVDHSGALADLAEGQSTIRNEVTSVGRDIRHLVEEHEGVGNAMKGIEFLVNKHQAMSQTCAYSNDSTSLLKSQERVENLLRELITHAQKTNLLLEQLKGTRVS